MVAKEIALVAAVSVFHVACLALPRNAATSLDPLLPPGIYLNDILDGGLAVVVALLHLNLFLVCAEHKSTSATKAQILIHTTGCCLLALASGGHMVANPLDEWLATEFPQTAAVLSAHRTVYWLHEYLFHRVTAAATMSLWLHTTACSAGTPEENNAMRSVIFVAVPHGFAQAALWIGTRTIMVAFPFQIALIYYSRPEFPTLGSVCEQLAPDGKPRGGVLVLLLFAGMICLYLDYLTLLKAILLPTVLCLATQLALSKPDKSVSEAPVRKEKSAMQRYASVFAAVSLAVQLVHIIVHRGAMPTFDDLTHESGSTSALSAASYNDNRWL